MNYSIECVYKYVLKDNYCISKKPPRRVKDVLPCGVQENLIYCMPIMIGKTMYIVYERPENILKNMIKRTYVVIILKHNRKIYRASEDYYLSLSRKHRFCFGGKE